VSRKLTEIAHQRSADAVMTERFSRRHGFRVEARPIRVREDAPAELRNAVVYIAHDLGLCFNELREILCRILHTAPDPGNWSEIPNVRDEVLRWVGSCEWFRVYDFIEEIYQSLPRDLRGRFADEVNEFFVANGIGWKLENGAISYRGDDEFERSVRSVNQVLIREGRQTAAREMAEALSDLSRLPEPDVTGAVQHAVAALECLARDVCNDPHATLGQLIQRHPDALALTPPLDSAAEKLWAFASQRGRHVREGHAPDRREAALVVRIAAALIEYLNPVE